MLSFSDRFEMPKHVLRFLEKESELLNLETDVFAVWMRSVGGFEHAVIAAPSAKMLMRSWWANSTSWRPYFVGIFPKSSGGWQISACSESILLMWNRFGNLVRSGNQREDSSSQVSRRMFRMISRRGHSCWGRTTRVDSRLLAIRISTLVAG